MTIVDLKAETPTPNTVTFEAWDSQREALVADNVLLKSGLNPSTDFEPEYITVNAAGTTAYVALQEANSIAVLDLASGQFTGIHSLGFKDHSQPGNELDTNKEDQQANLQTENFLGVYMPDGITLYEADGKTYLLTANEGDASEWEEYANITTVVTGTVENDGETTDVEVEVLDKTKLDGLPAVAEDTNFLLAAGPSPSTRSPRTASPRSLTAAATLSASPPRPIPTTSTPPTRTTSWTAEATPRARAGERHGEPGGRQALRLRGPGAHRRRDGLRPL